MARHISEIAEFMQKNSHWKQGVKWWANKLGVEEHEIIAAKRWINEGMLSLEPDSTSDPAQRSLFELDEEKITNSNQKVKKKVEELTSEEKTEYDQFLAEHNIDPDTVSQVWIKDKADGVAFSVNFKNIDIAEEDKAEAFRQALEEFEPSFIIPEMPNDCNDKAVVVSMYDMHLDAIGVFGDNYTLEDNINIAKMGLQVLLNQVAHYKPKTIFLPIGNDMFHTNDFRNVTKKGTPQMLNAHWRKSFKAGTQLIIDLIVNCLNYCENVVVIPIEGNHDEDKVFYLNEVIKRAFANEPRVSSEDESAPHFHYKFGRNLLSFGHGQNELKILNQIPARVAMEAAELWGQTHFREMYLGDKHHERKYNFLSDVEFDGYKVSYMSKMAANHNEWEYALYYHMTIRKIYCDVWDALNGKVCSLMYNV